MPRRATIFCPELTARIADLTFSFYTYIPHSQAPPYLSSISSSAFRSVGNLFIRSDRWSQADAFIPVPSTSGRTQIVVPPLFFFFFLLVVV